MGVYYDRLRKMAEVVNDEFDDPDLRTALEKLRSAAEWLDSYCAKMGLVGQTAQAVQGWAGEFQAALAARIQEFEAVLERHQAARTAMANAKSAFNSLDHQLMSSSERRLYAANGPFLVDGREIPGDAYAVHVYQQLDQARDAEAAEILSTMNAEVSDHASQITVSEHERLSTPGSGSSGGAGGSGTGRTSGGGAGFAGGSRTSAGAHTGGAYSPGEHQHHSPQTVGVAAPAWGAEGPSGHTAGIPTFPRPPAQTLPGEAQMVPNAPGDGYIPGTSASPGVTNVPGSPGNTIATPTPGGGAVVGGILGGGAAVAGRVLGGASGSSLLGSAGTSGIAGGVMRGGLGGIMVPPGAAGSGPAGGAAARAAGVTGRAGMIPPMAGASSGPAGTSSRAAGLSGRPGIVSPAAGAAAAGSPASAGKRTATTGSARTGAGIVPGAGAGRASEKKRREGLLGYTAERLDDPQTNEATRSEATGAGRASDLKPIQTEDDGERW